MSNEETSTPIVDLPSKSGEVAQTATSDPSADLEEKIAEKSTDPANPPEEIKSTPAEDRSTKSDEGAETPNVDSAVKLEEETDKATLDPSTKRDEKADTPPADSTTKAEEKTGSTCTCTHSFVVILDASNDASWDAAIGTESGPILTVFRVDTKEYMETLSLFKEMVKLNKDATVALTNAIAFVKEKERLDNPEISNLHVELSSDGTVVKKILFEVVSVLRK
ncbi:hypothetical protein BJ508DRAFT_304879 [Ascobolus immersus RN42]|uniref:Uncharacterized protein n=1 Tax=Ascobolus immersus RN42 TaxID=1160509 RepID=A0A3N4IAN9_ASCIM|nr:hypothetical protein BJ508DRAFT_304879 [Ascobolus immersus RN42]